MIGSSVLHYEITDKLGEGGMGEVYRATDSKLGREVAIKVLPEALVDDAERLARFEREARVLAALEHPRIAGIYGLEEAEGQMLLVMQLAPGEDLAARLARGPMALDEALSIALQIAEALEAAHDRGIVHRDLKPANVMVAGDGSVKVLDFGLAKAWDEGPGSDPNLTASPTLTANMTQAGVILGTAGYMSPEQARGQEADRRADIWSFGVVLHEMLTGQRLFQADTVSDTLARVLLADPEWETIDTSLPAPLAGLLKRCLERDSSRRLQAIGEARIAIEDYLADPQPQISEVGGEAARQPRRRFGLAPVLGGVALGALLAWSVSTLGKGGDATGDIAEPKRFSIHSSTGRVFIASDTRGLDISPDGRLIAMVGSGAGETDSVIYIKRPGDAEPNPVIGTEGGMAPFFSPDGQWLGFFRGQEIYKVRLSGGSSVRVTGETGRRGAVWHPDGTIYFAGSAAGPIARVGGAGGEVTAVTRLDETRNERTHRWPSLLPDGSALIYTSDTFESSEFYDDARIELVDLETGAVKVLLEGSSQAAWAPPGHLLYARDGSLYAAPFDLETREVTGPGQLALQGVLTTVNSGAVQFAVAKRGSMAWVPGERANDQIDLTWVDVDGNRELVANELGQVLQLALSPRGDKAVLVRAEGDSSADLWIYHLETETLGRFTFEGENTDPIWTPDGERIIFSSNRGDGRHPRIFWKVADGSGEAELLWDSEEPLYAIDISSDGRYLLAGSAPYGFAREGSPLWVFDMTGAAEPRVLINEPVIGNFASIAPDGRFVAYVSRTSGGAEVYVRPFPDGPGKWQISKGERLLEPSWAPDGRRIFLRGPEGLKSVDIDTEDGFRSGRVQQFGPRIPMITPFNSNIVSSEDGQRVLTLLPSVAERDDWSVHVALNWDEELRRLLETPR